MADAEEEIVREDLEIFVGQMGVDWMFDEVVNVECEMASSSDDSEILSDESETDMTVSPREDVWSEYESDYYYEDDGYSLPMHPWD